MRGFQLAVSLLTIGALSGCRGGNDPAATRAALVAALEEYTAATRTVDPDRIAPFYAVDAVLFEPGIPPIHTRDSIRAFIASFPGVVVEVATATADTIELYGKTAYLWGSYFERLGFPGQPVSAQSGRFVMQWTLRDDGRWQIRRLYRIPLATQLDSVPAP